MSAEERLVLMLEARVRDFEKKMESAERKGVKSFQGMQRGSRRATRAVEADMNRMAANVNKAMTGISGKIGAFGKATIAGLTAGVFAGITAGLGNLTRSMASLSNEAAMAGVGVEEFQKWKYVADQNRIGVDAMTDGLKEMQLRADEFAVTGKGPAAEAFQRIGYSAKEAKAALEDPSEMLLEIIRRTKDLDKAAQIRVADELFGGTAAEQFSILINQGDDAVRKMLNSAEEAGAVIDAELIEAAEELDRKFNALTTSAGVFFKRIVVGSAEAAVELTDFRAKLDALFENEGQGRAILGDEIYDSLAQNRDLVDQASQDIGGLRNQYTGLADDADTAAGSMMGMAAQLRAMGYEEQADQLYEIANALIETAGEFHAGEISADDFSARLQELTADAYSAFDALDEADRVNFGIAISQVDALAGALAGLISMATSASNAIASIAGISTGGGSADTTDDARARASGAGTRELGAERRARDGFLKSEAATNAMTKEQLRMRKEIGGVMKDAAEAGARLSKEQIEAAAAARIAADAARAAAGKSGRGGGGRSKGRSGGGGRSRAQRSYYDRASENILGEINELKLQAELLGTAAAGGRKYGEAMEFARTKADLLIAAQRDGKQITPELEAEIDSLAEQSIAAGLSLDALKDSLENVKSPLADLRDPAREAFRGLVDGSMEAGDALDMLMNRMQNMAIDNVFDMLWPDPDDPNAGGGIFAGLLGRRSEKPEAANKAKVALDELGETADGATGKLDGLGEGFTGLGGLIARLLNGGGGGGFNIGTLFSGGGAAGYGIAKLIGLADGGYVSGPGGPRADAIPAMLSNGEFVVNARQAQKFRPVLEAINSGNSRAFASGGAVGGGAMAGGFGSPQINIYENAVQGKTQVKQRGPGRTDVLMRSNVEGMIRSGGLDEALGSRFGMRPRPQG